MTRYCFHHAVAITVYRSQRSLGCRPIFTRNFTLMCGSDYDVIVSIFCPQVKRRNQIADVTKSRHCRHSTKLDYKADAICKPPVLGPGQQFHLDNRTKTVMPSAVSMGPPRQSNSYPTVVTKHLRSVSCQVSPASPKEIKKDQKVFKKPNTSTYSIKVEISF